MHCARNPPRAKFLRNFSKRSAKNAAKFWRNFSQIFVLQFPGKMAAKNFTKNPRHFPRCNKLSFFFSLLQLWGPRGPSFCHAHTPPFVAETFTQCQRESQQSARWNDNSQLLHDAKSHAPRWVSDLSFHGRCHSLRRSTPSPIGSERPSETMVSGPWSSIPLWAQKTPRNKEVRLGLLSAHSIWSWYSQFLPYAPTGVGGRPFFADV